MLLLSFAHNKNKPLGLKLKNTIHELHFISQPFYKVYRKWHHYMKTEEILK